MTAQPIPLRRFYVYVLKNEAGEVFYVGRGTGGRMMQHMARSHNDGVNGRLSEAVANDERVTAEVLSWHATASEAAEEERRQIQSYPARSLANLVHVARESAESCAPASSKGHIFYNLRRVAADIAALDKVREKLVTERDALIKAVWAEGHKLDDIALVAGLSRGRISQITDPRPAGRPRRPAQQ